MKTVHWLVACLGCVVLAAGPDAQESKPAGPFPAEQLASDLLTTADESARARLLGEHTETSRDDLCAALLVRGKASFKGGDTDAALAAFDAAARIAKAADLKRPLAEALYRSGVALDHRGELALAVEPLDRAERLSRELGDDAQLARIWNHRGLQARQLTQFEQAEDYFRRSFAIFMAHEEKDGASAVLGNLGLLCLNRGDLACALDAQQRSLALDPRNSYAIHNIAVIHETQGDDALALDAYLRAASIDREDGDAVAEATSLVEAGRMQIRLGLEPAALASFAKARETFEKAQAPDELGGLEYALGELHLRAGRAAEAVRSYQAAVARHESVSPLHLMDSLCSLSGGQLAAGQPDAALASARRSLEIARKLDSVTGLIQSWVAIGRAQEALARIDEAKAAYGEALAAIESEREHLAGDEAARQRFFEVQLKPYHRLLALAVAAGGQDEAFGIAEHARARVLVDVLQKGRRIGMRLLTPEEREREAAVEMAVRAIEVRLEAVDDRASAAAIEFGKQLDAGRRELAATRTALFNAHPELRLARGEAEIESASGLLPLLQDGSAALAFTVTEDATYAFVLTAPAGSVSLRVVTLPGGVNSWQRRVAAFRQGLARRDLEIAKEAQSLFADLLGPFRAELRGRKCLYVVPDGPLWELPFAALQPSAGHYLIEDTALATAPSLTALAAWRARPAPPRPADGYDVLAVAESEFGPGLPRLPAAARQAQAITASYGPASHALVGRDATEARVKAEAGRARVLHFATHGVLDPASPLYSALLLAPEPSGSADNGRLEAREILDLELPADLAVLSACETARGRIGAGEGVIGLSWAFSVAGVRNTVVSLWNVDAASTGDLMVAFHRRAQAGADYAEALRAAALSLLRDPKTRHPFYWAPFVLVGDGRPAQGVLQALPE